jgi:hypothetical protein
MLGFHLRFYFGVLKLASALYMFCQISEIFGKKSEKLPKYDSIHQSTDAICEAIS